MEILSLRELKGRLMERGAAIAEKAAELQALVHAQVGDFQKKEAKNGKPYFEIHFIDHGDKIVLRAWSDAPVYELCVSLEKGHCVEIDGDFSHHETYGLESKRWHFRVLTAAEQSTLMAGPKELRERQEADYQFIAETVQSLVDPRLRILCETFLVEHGTRFRRSAAARKNHHARRGGLVEHTSQMMRSACALAEVYQKLNRDLLIAGVLFHDTGKLWENHVAEDAFHIEHCERGELLGHINMGIEIVNSLWKQLKANDDFQSWKVLIPSSESVRLHLLHLIASHHGEMSFGSPVVPKTPEAFALHYIDNLDAKMEMVFSSYTSSKQVATNIYDKVWPLNYLIEPLKPFPPDADPSGGWVASGES